MKIRVEIFNIKNQKRGREKLLNKVGFIDLRESEGRFVHNKIVNKLK